MTRRYLPVLTLLIVTTLLTACLNKPVVQNDTSGQITVYTSFYPLFDFAAKIGGDKVTVENLLPVGIEPHDWEPGPQALATLQEADMLIVNGLGLEPWLETVKDSLEENVVVVIASDGIQPLSGYHHNHPEEEKDHGHEEEKDHGHEDDAVVADPHVWLDPLLALRQAENIARALMTADPENAAYYQANLRSFRQQLETLDLAFREGLADTTRREFVVTHLSFAYLAKRYGLNQQAIAGLSLHAEPTPAEMRQLVDFAREHGLRHIFSEPLSSGRLAEVLAAEIDATVLTLNPLEGLTEQEVLAGDDYVSVMYKNLEQLKIALTE